MYLTIALFIAVGLIGLSLFIVLSRRRGAAITNPTPLLSLDNSQQVLRLDNSQQERLRELERRSFYEYCERMGYDPSQHEAAILNLAKQELRRILETAEQRLGRAPTAAQIHAQILLATPDWWSFKRLQRKAELEALAGHIAGLESTLPINWDYLGGIAREFNLDPPQASSPRSLCSFLSAIPHVCRYGTRFNAFVGRETLIDGLPCICVYEQLIAAAEAFLDVVMRQVLRPSGAGRVSVVDENQWERIGSQPAFRAACRSAIEMVLARTDVAVNEADHTLSGSWPEMQLQWLLMSSGAADFVRWHEYGHLLMGHLLSEPGHSLEFEADHFAYEVVANSYAKTAGASFWSKVGALGVLVMILLIELIEQRPPSKTHPPAQKRIAALLRDGKDESINLFIHLQAMLGVCRRTVETDYGVPYFPVMSPR